jgi:hypothetical protein
MKNEDSQREYRSVEILPQQVYCEERSDKATEAKLISTKLNQRKR